MSGIREKWELPLRNQVRQIRCVHIQWAWHPGVCQLLADGSRWVWKISAFPDEDVLTRYSYWMDRVLRQAKYRCTMEWDLEVPDEWVERPPAQCANEFVAKWQSIFMRSGWLPGTTVAPTGESEQEWVLKQAEIGHDLVKSTGQALWSGVFQRAYWRAMACQKEQASRMGFISVSIGVIQVLMALLALCFCTWVAYNSLWVQSLPGFSWAKGHGHAALEHRRNQQEQWRLSMLGFVEQSQRRCTEGVLPAHCHLVDHPLYLLRNRLCGKKEPNPDSLEQWIAMLGTYARWASSDWPMRIPEMPKPWTVGGGEYSGCLPSSAPAMLRLDIDSTVAYWPDWTPDMLALIPNEQSKQEWIRGSYEARLALLRKCWELDGMVHGDSAGTKCESERRRLWTVAPDEWLQKLNLPGPVIRNWGHWDDDSLQPDSLQGEERALFTLLVERPRCEAIQNESEKRLVAWRTRYAQIRAEWMAGPAKSFPFQASTDEEIDAGTWTYWFGTESPFYELQKAYDTLSGQGLRLLPWERLSQRIDSLRGSSPFAPLAGMQWHYRFCGGSHLPVSLAVADQRLEWKAGMPCKEGEFSFASAWGHPLVWGRPPLNVGTASSPWQILRFVIQGTPKPGGGIRRQLRVDGGGFHEFASLELHVKQGNPRWLDLDNWKLNWPGLDALPISNQYDRSICYGQESQFPKRNSTSTSEYTLERGGRLGAAETRAAAQIAGAGAFRPR